MVLILTLVGGQVECLWDEVLPDEARELPEDLARVERMLCDEMLLCRSRGPLQQTARERGQPSIAVARLVRLMLIKQRTG